MEVLRHPGQLYVPQPAALYPTNMHRMFTPYGDTFECYPFEVSTPSRTPTPERPFRSYPRHGTGLDMCPQATTLHSVLRGEVPPAYSHLTTPSSHQLPSIFVRTSNTPLEVNPCHPALSPCLSISGSLSYSPRPSSNGSHTSQDSTSDFQTEPMDLSCKKRSRKRTAVSAFMDVIYTNDKSSALSSSLPAKLISTRASSSEYLSSSTFPSPASPTAPSMHRFPPSPGEGQSGEFSLLRNLLSVGKHHQTPPGLSHSTPNLISDRGCDSPMSDSFSRMPPMGNTRVQLAKKNLFPVSARVSDWLVKIVQFAKSIPEFASLPHDEKIILILNSWARIMLIHMAESNFQFAVTPIPSLDSAVDESIPSNEEPTMKAVEGLQTFIRKCQQMMLDSKEYDFFRMLVLFNSGYPGLSCPETIDQINSVVQQLLQQHVRVSRPNDVMHYSRLLMCLPSLYSTNNRMFQTLFCKHITENTDMEVLLKELLQTIS